MEVILLEKVRNLGGLGETIKVKPGYGRNFLIPQGKALRATKANAAMFEKRRDELEKKAAEILKVAQARADKLSKISISIAAMASDEGKLFGSIQPADIADAIVAEGGEVEKSEVALTEGPIRSIGEFQVTIQLHSDVVVPMTVVVEAAK